MRLRGSWVRLWSLGGQAPSLNSRALCLRLRDSGVAGPHSTEKYDSDPRFSAPPGLQAVMAIRPGG